ncbi:hypothetical protein ABTK59_19750, partial [Acinetobacter baumannii]
MKVPAIPPVSATAAAEAGFLQNSAVTTCDAAGCAEPRSAIVAATVNIPKTNPRRSAMPVLIVL